MSESKRGSAYKIDTGPIPLDVPVENPTGPSSWYRIPSWRVHFNCEALKGVDVRLHRAVASHAVWTLTEATTGFKMFSDIAHDQYIGDEGSMLAEFAEGVMLRLTPEKVAGSIARAKEILTKRPPNPLAVSHVATPKPQASYEPLTEDRVEELRRALMSDEGPTFTYTPDGYERLFGTLCDMAINSLHYAQEIDRLRAAPSSTRQTVKDDAITDADVALYVQSLRIMNTPWSHGCAELLKRIWQSAASAIATSTGPCYDCTSLQDCRAHRKCLDTVRRAAGRADAKKHSSHGTRGGPEGEGP